MSKPNIVVSEYMTLDKTKLLNKVNVLKDLIAEQSVYTHQCQLLHSQLTDLILFCDKLSEACCEMNELMEQTK